MNDQTNEDEAENIILVSCDREGRIEIWGDGMTPSGLLPIIRGPEGSVLQAIMQLARLAYDNETLLVPGVPEANSAEEGIGALIAFTKRVHATVARIQGAT